VTARVVANRAAVKESCYFVARADGTRVPEHGIEPDARGFFRVTSARSGNEYRVDARTGRCSCPGFAGRGACTHAKAVYEFAADVLSGGCR
jgi:SWIM zinc finger.